MTKFKKILEKFPIIGGIIIQLVQRRRLRQHLKKIDYRERRVRELSGITEPFRPDKNSKIIVSLTTYPRRIDKVWLVVESLFQQDIKLHKVVLTLAISQFPGKTIPCSLQKQVERGLELIWVDQDTRSYKKLIPAIELYSDYYIVTVDDDVIYEPWRIRKLVEAEKTNPGAIVGHRGWKVGIVDETLEKYINWEKANIKTKFPALMLTGVGGIIYPPNTLRKELLLDMDRALELCPTGDDIWFWAVSILSEANVICLGNHANLDVEYENEQEALHHINRAGGHNDVQIDRVVSHFNLLQKLLKGN